MSRLLDHSTPAELSDRLRDSHAMTAELMSDIIRSFLPALSIDRPDRQDRPYRAADPVRRLDRCGAGADRPGTAAMAGSPRRLRRGRMVLRAVAPTRIAGLARSIDRGPSCRPGAGDPERLRRGPAGQRALAPDQHTRRDAGHACPLRAGLQRQFRVRPRVSPLRLPE